MMKLMKLRVKLREYLTQLLARLESYKIKQVPRAENEVANRLAKIASSLANIDSRKITFLTFSKKEACRSNEPRNFMHSTEEHEPSLKDEILKYLLCVDLPPDSSKARKLKARVVWFTIIKGDLYERGYSQPFLKCLTPSKADYVLLGDDPCRNMRKPLKRQSTCKQYAASRFFLANYDEDALELV